MLTKNTFARLVAKMWKRRYENRMLTLDSLVVTLCQHV